MITMRYEVQEDIENDCLTIEDKLGLISNSFGSEQLILSPIEDAEPLIERLQFLECYVKKIEDEHLKYLDYSDHDIDLIKEEVELDME